MDTRLPTLACQHCCLLYHCCGRRMCASHMAVGGQRHAARKRRVHQEGAPSGCRWPAVGWESVRRGGGAALQGASRTEDAKRSGSTMSTFAEAIFGHTMLRKATSGARSVPRRAKPKTRSEVGPNLPRFLGPASAQTRSRSATPGRVRRGLGRTRPSLGEPAPNSVEIRPHVRSAPTLGPLCCNLG